MAGEFMANPDEIRRALCGEVRALSSQMKEAVSSTQAEIKFKIENACAIKPGDTDGYRNEFNHVMAVATDYAKVLDNLADHLDGIANTFQESDRG